MSTTTEHPRADRIVGRLLADRHPPAAVGGAAPCSRGSDRRRLRALRRAIREINWVSVLSGLGGRHVRGSRTGPARPAPVVRAPAQRPALAARRAEIPGQAAPAQEVVLIVAALIVQMVVLAFALTPVDNFFYDRLFWWVPFEGAGGSATTYLEGFPRSVVIITLAACLPLTGVSLPIIEELYFRGFLLPRLSQLGRWAPVVNTVLFSLYHLWSPWTVLTRVIFMFAGFWLVRQKKDLRLSIGMHAGTTPAPADARCGSPLDEPCAMSRCRQRMGPAGGLRVDRDQQAADQRVGQGGSDATILVSGKDSQGLGETPSLLVWL